MRITESMKTNTFLYDLNKSLERMMNTQNTITSTKKINKPSDDPAGTAKLMRLKNNLSRYERYQANVDDAVFYTSASESALNQLNDTISKATAILLQASNDTIGSEERLTLAGQMRDLWETAIQSANQKFANRYLFGGTNDHEIPFTMSNQITDEAMTASFDEAVALASTFIEEDTLTITDYFEEGADFTIDYENGTVTALSGGRLADGDDYYISYELNEGITQEESFTASHDTAVALSNSNLLNNSIKVYRHFEENTDYTVDYENGKLTLLTGGEMIDGRAYAVSYQAEENSFADLNEDGVDGDLLRVIDEGTVQKINVNAEEVFAGEEGLLNVLKKAYVALERDDFTEIKAAKEALENNVDHITSMQGRLGVIQNRLEFQQDKLSADKVNLEKLISNIEDTDIATAIVELQNDQAVFQSALRTGADIIRTTLIDFLG